MKIIDLLLFKVGEIKRFVTRYWFALLEKIPNWNKGLTSESAVCSWDSQENHTDDETLDHKGCSG